MTDAVETAVVEARAVAKSYGGLRAVDGVSFVVGAGEVLGIAGPNGAGKTTLFDVLGGHVEASGGEILLTGEDITRASIHHRCRLGLARTFQQPTVAGSLTVLENAYVAARHRRGRESRSRADDVEAARAQLQRLGLAGLERPDRGVAARVRPQAAHAGDGARHQPAGAPAGRAVRRAESGRDRRDHRGAASACGPRAWRWSASST